MAKTQPLIPGFGLLTLCRDTHTKGIRLFNGEILLYPQALKLLNSFTVFQQQKKPRVDMTGQEDFFFF